MHGVLDAPVAAVDTQQRLGIGGVRGVAGHAPAVLDGGVDDLALAHLAAGAADEEGLTDAGEVEVVVECGGGPDLALLPAPVPGGQLALDGLAGVFDEVGGALCVVVEPQPEVCEEGFLVVLGDERVVGVLVAQVRDDFGLGEEGIGGDGLAGEVAELAEQRERDPDLVGTLLAAVIAGQDGFFWPQGMAVSWPQAPRMWV